MNKGVAGALALILLWISFTAFFVAFHPGGIRDPMFQSPTNPQGFARNPVDIILWMMKRAAQGPQANSQGSAPANATTDASVTTNANGINTIIQGL